MAAMMVGDDDKQTIWDISNNILIIRRAWTSGRFPTQSMSKDTFASATTCKSTYQALSSGHGQECRSPRIGGLLPCILCLLCGSQFSSFAS